MHDGAQSTFKYDFFLHFLRPSLLNGNSKSTLKTINARYSYD